jgi:hypothetical protein
VNAGDDFEVAGPSIVTRDDGTTTEDCSVFCPVPQVKEIISEDVGNTAPNLPSMEHSSYSFGEYFSSVKQIISRFNFVRCTLPVISSNTVGGYWPYHISVWYPSADALSILNGGFQPDAFSYIGAMYAFYRGSMNVNISTNVPNNVLAVVRPDNQSRVETGTSGGILTYSGVPTLDTNGTVPNYASTGFCGVGVSDNGPGNSSFHVPYYAMGKGSCAQWTLGDGTPQYDISAAQNRLYFRNQYNSADVKFAILRAAGDDFQFSYFIGCPPVVVDYKLHNPH